MANDDFPNDDFLNQFKDMINKMFGHQFDSFMNFFNDPEIMRKLQEDGHVNFGFSLNTDENGNININPFNPDMITPNQLNPSMNTTADPFFDVMQDGDQIVIVGEVPGFSKEDLHIGSKGSSKLVIKGKNEPDSFTKEIDLPEFDIKSVKAKLRNGSLEITVKALKDELDGHKITIE